MHRHTLRFSPSLTSADKGVVIMALTMQNIEAMINRIRDTMVANQDYLIELDQALGDGDLGLSMTKGFTEAAKAVHESESSDIGRVLVQAGMVFNNAAPSTMGTLMATALMRAGKSVSGKESVDLADLVDMGEAAVKGIMDRGKAKVGEKTILDALVPAVEALKAGAQVGESYGPAFEKAYAASLAGLEATKNMMPEHGRARYYREKAIGKQDPGATAAMLVTKALKEYFTSLDG